VYLDRYDQIKVYAEEGRAIGISLGSVEIFAQCTRFLGSVGLHERDFSRAESMFSQALESYEEVGYRLRVADTRFAMAKLAFEKGETVNAEQMLDIILREYEDLKCRRGIAEVHVMLAKMQSAPRGYGDQATDHLRRAEKVYRTMGNIVESDNCRSILDSIDSN
jgi:hypothetical protein